MFKKEKPKPAASTPSRTTTPNNDHTIIGNSAQIKGDLHCTGDLRVDGKLEGNVSTTSRIVVGKTGIIKGNLNCSSAEVHGRIMGDIACKGLLALRPGCLVEGGLSVGQLTMEDGANLNSSSVVTSKNTTSNEPKASSPTPASA